MVPADDERETRALHGLSRALLNNMVVGVSEGYRRELQTVGVGYRANLQGKKLELLLGSPIRCTSRHLTESTLRCRSPRRSS